MLPVSMITRVIKKLKLIRSAMMIMSAMRRMVPADSAWNMISNAV